MTDEPFDHGCDRHVLRPEGGRGRSLSLLGGKGGIGKSSIALNLGLALAKRGVRVVLADASAPSTSLDVLREVSPPERGESVGPHGLRIARLSVNGGGRTAGADVRSETVDRLRRSADVLLIDCGSGLNPVGVSLSITSDMPVLTATPEPAALTDAYATAKLLRSRGYDGPVGLVVNMARSRREAGLIARRFRHATSKFLGFEVKLLGSIPFDRHVAQAARQRRPLLVSFPRCAASVSLERIARRVEPAGSARAADSGWWVRVASLFL